MSGHSGLASFWVDQGFTLIADLATMINAPTITFNLIVWFDGCQGWFVVDTRIGITPEENERVSGGGLLRDGALLSVIKHNMLAVMGEHAIGSVATVLKADLEQHARAEKHSALAPKVAAVTPKAVTVNASICKLDT